ncbi:MAG: site-specific DNA-methyltransferase, partial [Fibrobacter sp.]|nr:site-specific DNA-methyltransferase [Fibrobacter sp.]MDY5723967.1 site-specific DNA-methyltransferase [Fibrobacter sp.]
MEHLKMKTADMASENFEKLKALFPNCVTESLDKDGNPVRAIDKDLLMQEINSEVVEGQKERYQFNWPGKRDAIRKANAPTTMTLRPCKDESVDFDNTQNLYIEGDNLEVLKLLQNNYLGKVKMIYIDPPYNTGNDFVYNDNFKQDSETFLETSGMFDEDGNMTLQNFEKNSESNGRFHTDWLNMMY